MKVAFIIDTIQPFYTGGYETRAWEFARRLARSHDVTVFTSVDHDCILEGVKFRKVRSQAAYFGGRGFRSLKQTVFFSVALLQLLKLREHYDVVDCNATPFLHLPVGWLVAKRCGAMLVVTAHESLGNVISEYFKARKTPFTSAISWLARSIYMIGHSVAHVIITPTQVTADSLTEEGFRRVHVVPNGIGALGETKRREFSPVNVGYLGRIVRNKRLYKLLEAFDIAKGRGFRGKLYIIGDGPDYREVKRDIEVRGLQDAVVITGHVSEETKRNLLSNEVGIFASASYREGFSIATLEAMAFGNPVVVASKPERFKTAVLEYIRDGINGIVTDGEPPSMADAILTLEHNKQLYQKLSMGGHETAKAYLWDVLTTGLERAYNQVLQSQNNA